MREEILTYYDGFHVKENTLELDIADAGALLRSKARRRCSYAIRHGDRAEIRSALIICSFCGGAVPAYGRFLDFPDKEASCCVSRRDVDNWASPQYSLFPGSTLLELNRLCVPKYFRCPRCGELSTPGREQSVLFRYNSHKLIISTAADIGQLLDIHTGSLTPPFSVSLEFNLKRGRTILRYYDAQGCVSTRDLSFDREGLQYSSIGRAFRHRLVRRYARRIFRSLWGEALPFSAGEIDPDTLAVMTQFIGYDREFFDSLPYCRQSRSPDPSFRSVARLLHRKSSAAELCLRFGLNGSPVIEKRLEARPALLLYAEELSRLFRLFSRESQRLALLESRQLYPLLALLHSSCASMDFLSDYALKMGHELLLSAIDSDSCVLNYASRYAALSPAMRRQERRQWTSDEFMFCTRGDFSIPLPKGECPDCSIDEYHFAFARSTGDAADAQDQLLCSFYGPRFHPPLLIKKSGFVVAALEICNGRILQLHYDEYFNDPRCGEFYSALNKWAQRFGMEFSEGFEPARPKTD